METAEETESPETESSEVEEREVAELPEGPAPVKTDDLVEALVAEHTRKMPPPADEPPEKKTGAVERIRSQARPAARRPPTASPPQEEKSVTQRKRSKVSQGKTPTHKGVPYDQIEEAQALYETLDLRIARVSARGTRSSLGSFNKTPAELADVEIWLREVAGGGKFHVQSRKPDGTGNADPIPGFEFEIEAPPKAMRASDINTAGAVVPIGGVPGFGAVPAGGGMPPMMGNAAMQMLPAMQPYVDQKLLPPIVRNMPQAQQVAWAQSMGIPVVTAPPGMPQHTGQAPMNAFASDQIANKELDRAQRELAQERAQRETERKETAAREQETRERMDRLEQERRDDQRRAEQQRHDQQMESLRTDMARDREQTRMLFERPKGLFSNPDSLVAIGGIVTALINSSSDRSAKVAELQSQGQQALLTATMTKADHKPTTELIKAIAPLALPFLTQFMEAKSPSAQADLVATMAENQLTSISMMANLITDFGAAQENPPYWLPMAQKALEGIVQAAEAVAQKNKEVAGVPQQPTQLQAQAGTVAPQQPQQLSGRQITQMVIADPRCPEWVKDEKWVQALNLLHDRAPLEETVEYIAKLLHELNEAGTTPKEIEGVWDEADVVLKSILEPLPIWEMDNAYAVAVINGVIDILAGDEDPGGEPMQPDNSTQREDSGTPIVTPPATAPVVNTAGVPSGAGIAHYPMLDENKEKAS